MNDSPITLTEGQQAAFDSFCQFLLDPVKNVFVLKGYAGTGKSTLVKHLLEKIPALDKGLRLIDPEFHGWNIKLTATTNKACEALSQLVGGDWYIQTIHSYLGLLVKTDYRTGKKVLEIKHGTEPKYNTVIFIDEASFLDQALLEKIFELTRFCKIIFMGDPAQLTTVNSKRTPALDLRAPSYTLTEVVRQAKGNPIIELATAFRETVNTGEWFNFRPDGTHLIWLNREDWRQAIMKEFCRPDWGHNDSKVLVWTNNCSIQYNHAIRDMAEGNPNFQIGDYAVVNQFLSAVTQNNISVPSLKTDQTVRITDLAPAKEHGVDGWMVTMDGGRKAFLPATLGARKSLIRKAKNEANLGLLRHIDNTWVDLRAAYSCTINKSQGSTYDTVFIDLDDIKACNNANQVARMMYVAVSRARSRVIFTGDLV